jgi:hypothetical protein
MRPLPALSALLLTLSVASPATASLFCPVLKSRDGFVPLRYGPGIKHAVIAQMK